MTENFPDAAENNAETAAVWACPTCLLPASMPYCEACGERKPHPQELTLMGLCKQALEAFTNYDSRLLQTFRKLLLAPGSLTLMYLKGSRKPYLGPFGLFLLANVIFVGMEALAGSNAFSSPLEKHLHEQPWSDVLGSGFNYAEQLVTQRLVEKGTTLAAYTPVFDEAVAANSKAFIFFMVPPFALITGLLFLGERRPFATHLVYSLHFHSFLLMLIGCTMLVMWLDVLLGGAGLEPQLADDIVSVMLLVVVILYLHSSAINVYQPGPYMRILKTAALTVAATVIFLGYRFLLFVFTLYTT